MIVTVHEIAINYEFQLKFLLIFKGISANVKLSRSLHFRIWQRISLLKTFITLWWIFMYATGCLVMNSTILAVPIKHNIILHFLEKIWDNVWERIEILLGNNNFFTLKRPLTKRKSFWSYLGSYFPSFYKSFYVCQQNVFKNIL